MVKKRCVVCGRERLFESEGRYIDGSWVEDKEVLGKNEALMGKWVCCWKCYERLFKREGVELWQARLQK